MSRQLLIEQCGSFKNNEYKYIKESSDRHKGEYLGTVAGVCADLVKPTRNGRKYTEQLWRNVINSPDFQEGMRTFTIFGETDHPEDRLETKTKEIAMVMTKFEIRPEEGVCYGEFDILNTPNGKILKSLLDYGCQIGVSSRGSGEEIMVNGETIIDPDTYYFVCFDAVITPAVEQARPEYLKSKVTQSADESKAFDLSASILNEINSATTFQELESIKSIILATKIPQKDNLLESIGKKINELRNGDNISSKLVEELAESSARIEELTSEIESLKKAHTADNIRLKQMRQAIKENNSNRYEVRKYLSKSERRYPNFSDREGLNESYLKQELKCKTESLDSLTTENNELKLENENLRNLYTTARMQISKTQGLLNDSIDNTVSRGDYQRVCENAEKVKSQMSRVLGEQKQKNNTLAASNKILKDKNSSLYSENKLLKSGYLQMKSTQCGFSRTTIESRLPNNYGIKDIDRVVSELSDKYDRLNQIPVALPNIKEITINEPKNNFIDEEMNHTISMLEAVRNR